MKSDLRLCGECMKSVDLPSEETQLAYRGYAPKRLVACEGKIHARTLILVDEHGMPCAPTIVAQEDPFDVAALKRDTLRAGHSLTL